MVHGSFVIYSFLLMDVSVDAGRIEDELIVTLLSRTRVRKFGPAQGSSKIKCHLKQMLLG